ncbi:MAG: methionyl-tRNA formyltransferase [Deltaproteobacteria bacterium]|nr:MAG: methionyl-tRNA formyltransferase [Deltaproteobacteria bacterium]
MKIILIGQGPFGRKVLESLFQRGEDIAGVFSPPGKRGEEMSRFSKQKGIKLFQPRHVKAPEVHEAFQELKPELVILAFVTDIVPERLLEIPVIGTICYHPSLLPRHRGASSINWAIIQAEKKTGLTILWVDKGVDTGPILIQKEVEIGPDDTAGSLYFEKLFPMGVEALLEAVDLIKSGKAPRIPQDDSVATYEPPCDDRVARIDWEKPAPELYNLVRGCDPQPGAYCMVKGQKLRLFKTRLIDVQQQGVPGEMTRIGETHLEICLNGGCLKVGSVRPDGGEKIGAAEFARNRYLEPGMLFE